VGGAVDGGPRVAHLLDQVRRDVVRHVLVHQVRGLPGRRDADHRRQRFVLDLDQVPDVLGEIPVGGHHHDHWLADVPDIIPGQRVRRAGRTQRGVRDEQRQRLGDLAGEVVPGVDGHQTGRVERGRHVDVHDPGVRVRAADERRGQRAGTQVVQVRPAPADQPGVLPARDRLPEELRHCWASSAARNTALTMFW
jgi:hypothetical protein